MTTTVAPPRYPFPGDERLDTDARYAALRSSEPVSRVTMANGEPAWLVTRYDDMKAILSDPRFSRSLVAGQDVTTATHRMADQPRSVILPLSDPPEHTTIRRLVSKAFTARRVETIRPRAEQIVENLLDNLAAAQPPADFVALVAMPLPVTIITDILGIEGPAYATMRHWSEALMSVTALDSGEVVAIKDEFESYMRAVVEQRRADPGDDLVSALIRAGEDGDSFTDDEMMSVIMLLFIAGYETTVSQLTNQVYTLLSRAHLWHQLRADPSLVPQAVEELLRAVPVGYAGLPIRATEDVALGGIEIAAGDFVLLPKYAGNLDPDAFGCPASIHFSRTHNPHLAFGHGAHYCIGAPLARMEIQVALTALVRRFGSLSLAVDPDDLAWRTGALIRGPRDLPVTW
ncbi:MAG: cytochrome P450 [Jatrophihabitans sp.]